MPQKIDSQKLSQIVGQAVEVTVNDGETLDQAEARVMREHPDIFKSVQQDSSDFGVSVANDAADDQPIALPEHIIRLRDMAGSLPLGSKEQEKALRVYEAVRDDWFKTHPQPKGPTAAQLKEENQNNTIDDIKNSLNILKEIETYPGPVSLPASLVQNIGEFLGVNPELTQYKQKTDMLLAPIAKGIQGEVGNLSEFEQKAAKAFLPQGAALFSEPGRDAQLKNLFDSIQARTGRNLPEEMDEETLRQIGAISFLGKKLKGTPVGASPATTSKPTHRFNPQTGQLERIQ